MKGRLGVLAAIAGILLWQSPATAATLPKPTHTTKTRFRIPFKFDAVALKRMNAREVQLHVSHNQGETWELAQVLAPDGGKFDYVCAAEGEYWFAVKTLDGQSQLHPPRGSYETGLIVIVDTTNPQLDLSLQQTAAGKVQIRWRASDSNLDIETVQLDYLSPGSNDWTPLDIAPRARGETGWIVKQSGIVSVRGSIADYAGNVANTKVQIEVDAQHDPAVKQRSTPQGKIATIPLPDDAVHASEDGALSATKVPDPDDGEPGRLGSISTRNGVPSRPLRPIDQFALKPTKTITDVGRSSIPATPISTEKSARDTGRLSPFPDLTNRLESVPQQSSEQDSTIKNLTSSRRKYVTSPRFQVGYQLENVGPSGIGAVELFITEDNGRKWWKYGDDPDQKSPFDVEVPRDGKYGFAIRARSGAGLSNDPPIPGEPPAIVITVDQTAPTVELLPIQQGQGANFNRLLIQWRATDEHLSEKSVSLYYSASRNGTWEPISGWQDYKNAEYEWAVSAGTPVQFYVRVMVRDAAGNVGISETSQPITVDLSRPTAQILDVETAPGSGPQ